MVPSLGAHEAAALVALGVDVGTRLDAELAFALLADEGRVGLHAVEQRQLLLLGRQEVVVEEPARVARVGVQAPVWLGCGGRQVGRCQRMY